MKSHLFLLLAVGALALTTACSTPTKVNSGQVRARTFSFVDPGPNTLSGYADTRQPVHAMIQEAITKNLAARGVTRAPSGGDVIVGYLVIVGNNVSTEVISKYFGYSDDMVALHEKANKAYTNGKNPNYFEAGTLVIDIIDSKGYKLLKRGYASRPILRNLTDDARGARIQEVVNQILADVRIAP